MERDLNGLILILNHEMRTSEVFSSHSTPREYRDAGPPRLLFAEFKLEAWVKINWHVSNRILAFMRCEKRLALSTTQCPTIALLNHH